MIQKAVHSKLYMKLFDSLISKSRLLALKFVLPSKIHSNLYPKPRGNKAKITKTYTSFPDIKRHLTLKCKLPYR